MGRSQAVRHRFLVSACVGSNPTAPATKNNVPMSNQLLLSLKEVIVSYHKKEIFKDLDLVIHRKDFIALVGKNGAGKSTLMNVLTENHEIDNGEIWKIDNLKISYFNQNFFFNDESELGLKNYFPLKSLMIQT